MKTLTDEDSVLGSFPLLLFYQNMLGMIVLINFHLFPPTPSTVCSLICHIRYKPRQANTDNCRFLNMTEWYPL